MANPTYQSEHYADARPTYPPELFDLIFSKTPSHDFAWDAGTGTGQAISPLAKTYKKVIGTDISAKQVELAPKLPNVTYFVTPPSMSIHELQQTTSLSESALDLISVAEALHYYDLPNFYAQVKWALKKPDGLFAAWCYPPMPEVDDKVNAVFRPFCESCDPYFSAGKKLVDDGYRGIPFPFEPVDGLDHTGPFEFVSEKVMRLEDYLRLIRSWSAYDRAKEKGVELLTEEMVQKFRAAWNSSGTAGDVGGEKVVKFPIYLRIGKVGNSN